MKVLVDTNIILNVLFYRATFFDQSRKIFELLEQNQMEACISASAFTDIFYLVKKEIKDTERVYQAVDTLAALFTIAPVSENTIKSAFALRWKDFEDAVQYSAAKENKLDCIVTRNKDDYTASDIPCVSPVDFLAFYKSAEPVLEDNQPGY
jgi:predicted nucleic acid-binding protein